LQRKSESHPRESVDGSSPFYKTEKNNPSADCEVHTRTWLALLNLHLSFLLQGSFLL